MPFRMRLAIAALGATAALGSWWAGSARAGDPVARAEKQEQIRRGAQLWPSVCGGCHNARGAAERSAAEWDVVVQHMRVRANLPGEDARAILEYLKRR